MVLALSLAVFSMSTSCKKEEEKQPEQAIPASEAAELIATSLGDNSGGMSNAARSLSDLNNDNKPSGRVADAVCGVPLDINFPVKFTTTNISYDYTFKYKLTYTCNGVVPTSLTAAMNTSGNYEGLVFKTNNTNDLVWNVTGLELASTPLTFNGSYKYAGSTTNKKTNRSYTFTIDHALTNAVFSKSLLYFTSGTTATTITGSSPEGSFSYTGTLTYTAGNKATLNINGEQFTVLMEKGEIQQ